jgi:hypothetical protein
MASISFQSDKPSTSFSISLSIRYIQQNPYTFAYYDMDGNYYSYFYYSIVVTVDGSPSETGMNVRVETFTYTTTIILEVLYLVVMNPSPASSYLAIT